MNRGRLLIIDDDLKLCRLIANYLQPLGYSVAAEHTGPLGLNRALDETFDAVLLDVMLPGLSGLDVLRELRKQSSVPVLILTALGEESDRIVGLEIGADDYLPKTFSTRERLARLRAVLRTDCKIEGATADRAYCIGRSMDRYGDAPGRSKREFDHTDTG